jgi:hypothetical protein
MATTLGDDVNRSTVVKQHGLVASAQVVQAKALKPSFLALRKNALVTVVGVRSLVTEKSSLGPGGAGNIRVGA